jgi:molybdate transport system substrate-binding protein
VQTLGCNFKYVHPLVSRASTLWRIAILLVALLTAQAVTTTLPSDICDIRTLGEDIMMTRWSLTALCGALLAASSISVAQAADLKLLGPTAMRAVISEVAPQFDRASGHKVTIEFATVGAITERLLKGEAADATTVSALQMEELQKQGKVVAGSRADIARVGVGVFIKGGAPKLDISSVDAFKRTLQNAKSVGYGNPAAGGVSGVHMAALVERLGIAAEIRPKTQLFPDSQAALDAVAKGMVDVGIGLTSDSALVSGVDLVGALPADIQNFTLYSAGVVAGSKQQDAAKALIAFFGSPTAQAAMRAKGFEPR